VSEKAKLYAKLARVMGQMDGISKDGYNQSFGYKFIRDVDVANAIRPLLAEEGVAVLVGMEDVQQDPITSGSGSQGYHTVARMTITFADGETGATHTIPWYGEANDYQDKSVNKCATAGLKYALLKTFMVGSEDDPDASAGTRKPKRQTSGNAGDIDIEKLKGQPIGFGKFKEQGRTWGWILENERGYLEWLRDNSDYEDTVNKVEALLDGGNGAGDNGSEPKGKPPTPELLDRWSIVAAEAESLGIDFDPLPDDANYDTVKGRGVALKQLIDAKKKKGSFPADVVEQLVQEGLSENRYSVTATLKKSDLEPSDPYDKVEQWFTIYRGERAEGEDSDAAAATANTWLATNYG